MMITLEGESIRKTDPHRHKFDSALAEMLYGMDQSVVGDAEAPTGWWVQYGKRILRGNSQGFVWVENWETVAAADDFVAELEADYYAWDSQDEEEA